MKQKFTLFRRLLLFSVVCILLSSCFVQNPTSTPEAASPSIVSLDIPNETINYPEDWPEDLRLPVSFSLVEANSGTSVGGSSQGWTAMYRFDGSVDEAESAINKHYFDNGWEIVGIEKQEIGGYKMLVQKGETEGFLVIELDSENQKQTLIMTTIFR